MLWHRKLFQFSAFMVKVLHSAAFHPTVEPTENSS